MIKNKENSNRVIAVSLLAFALVTGLSACKDGDNGKNNVVGTNTPSYSSTTQVLTESVQVPTESVQVPTESVQVPTESVEVTTESVQLPTDSELAKEIHDITVKFDDRTTKTYSMELASSESKSVTMEEFCEIAEYADLVKEALSNAIHSSEGEYLYTNRDFISDEEELLIEELETTEGELVYSSVVFEKDNILFIYVKETQGYTTGTVTLPDIERAEHTIEYVEVDSGDGRTA